MKTELLKIFPWGFKEELLMLAILNKVHFFGEERATLGTITRITTFSEDRVLAYFGQLQAEGLLSEKDGIYHFTARQQSVSLYDMYDFHRSHAAEPVVEDPLFRADDLKQYNLDSFLFGSYFEDIPEEILNAPENESGPYGYGIRTGKAKMTLSYMKNTQKRCI